jgi:recombinational DNA repair protein (RecF pathway)
MDLNKDYEDILFIITPKSSNACKICGKDYDKENFYKYRHDLCKACFSKEANFCRVRKVLWRAFKELNVDKDTAIKILLKERKRIYRKLPINRDERIVVI